VEKRKRNIIDHGGQNKQRFSFFTGKALAADLLFKKKKLAADLAPATTDCFAEVSCRTRNGAAAGGRNEEGWLSFGHLLLLNKETVRASLLLPLEERAR
jgi:hypothetical protein